MFTAVYVVEAVMLIYCDWRNYFNDEWKRFDFFIVVMAVIAIVVKNFV